MFNAAIPYLIGLIVGLCIGWSVGVVMGRRDARWAASEGIEPPPSSFGGIDRRPNPWWRVDQ